jgi:hypothetical protein
MKNLTHLVVLACLIISCSSPKRDVANESSVAQRTTEDDLFIAPLSLDSAALYISNFLNHPSYGNLAKNVALGGAFTTPVFQVPADKEGVLFWFCQNKSDASYPEFFLALEHTARYDTAAPPAAPTGALSAPAYTFTYPGNKTAKEDVKDYLEAQTQANQNTGKPLSKTEANPMIAEFKALIKSTGNCETDNCKYPHGYFDGKDGNYMNAFLANNPVMVRYYFGYDKHYAANSIRIILIGTDKQGANIISTAKGNGDASILQKSIPPPPIN